MTRSSASPTFRSRARSSAGPRAPSCPKDLGLRSRTSSRWREALMLPSVLVPLYNDRNLVPTMLGLVCQALPDVEKEIIIVDDCSTDGSRDWLRESFPDGARSCTRVAVGPNGRDRKSTRLN